MPGIKVLFLILGHGIFFSPFWRLMPYARQQQPNRLVLMPACSFPRPLEQQWDNSAITIPFNKAVKTTFYQGNSIVAHFWIKSNTKCQGLKIGKSRSFWAKLLELNILLQGTG